MLRVSNQLVFNKYIPVYTVFPPLCIFLASDKRKPKKERDNKYQYGVHQTGEELKTRSGFALSSENEPLCPPSYSSFLPRSDHQDQAWLCKFPKPVDNIARPVNRNNNTAMVRKQKELNTLRLSLHSATKSSLLITQ